MLPNVSVAVNRNKLPNYVHVSGTGFTHLLALYWLMVSIHETHVTPSSGKVKTKRHLFSYLVISGSECCPMCQLLQTRTNYHITYIWLLQVAFILWHYIDWWCLFMKPIWCLLVAKYKLKGICSHTLLLQVASPAQCVSCSKQEQIKTLLTFAWYWLHPPSGIIMIDGVYSWNTCNAIYWQSKVYTKRHLISYLVISGSECCPMCQLL